MAEVGLTFALKQNKINRKQELTGKEVVKENRGPALEKKAKQYWTMPWIIASLRG